MKITPEEIKRLARLSWLELSQADIDRYAKELSSILEYVEKLNELDTSKVDPTYHVVPHKLSLRKDEVYKSISKEDFLSGVPQHEDGTVKVPKIIETDI